MKRLLLLFIDRAFGQVELAGDGIHLGLIQEA